MSSRLAVDNRRYTIHDRRVSIRRMGGYASDQKGMAAASRRVPKWEGPRCFGPGPHPVQYLEPGRSTNTSLLHHLHSVRAWEAFSPVSPIPGGRCRKLRRLWLFYPFSAYPKQSGQSRTPIQARDPAFHHRRSLRGVGQGGRIAFPTEAEPLMSNYSQAVLGDLTGALSV